MKILYVAPSLPMKSGIAYYAEHFKNAMAHFSNIQIARLDIYQNKNIFNLKEFLSMGNKIKSFKKIREYDIIHFEIGGGQNREFYIFYFIKKNYPSIKTIVTLHDPPLILSSPMKFIGLEKMPRMIRGVRKIADLTIGRYWEKKIIEQADQIICLSEIGRQKIQKRLRRNIFYVPHLYFEIDAQAKKYRENIKKILFFGYLGSKKGIDILIKSIARLLKRFPKYRDIQLFICGGFPVGRKDIRIRGNLQRLAEALNMEKNIVFTGNISEEEKILQLKDADIMVLPYRAQKTFGTSGALIQGMSYGLPIVVTDVKNFVNEIEDGKTGLLVEDGNLEMLTDKLKLLAENRSLRCKLGENAKDHVRKEHHPELIVNKIWQIYQECLETK